MRRGIFNRVDTYSFTGIIPTPETKQASDQFEYLPLFLYYYFGRIILKKKRGRERRKKWIITSNLENEHLLILCQKRNFLMDSVLDRIPVHPYDLIADLKPRKKNERTKTHRSKNRSVRCLNSRNYTANYNSWIWNLPLIHFCEPRCLVARRSRKIRPRTPYHRVGRSRIRTPHAVSVWHSWSHRWRPSCRLLLDFQDLHRSMEPCRHSPCRMHHPTYEQQNPI